MNSKIVLMSFCNNPVVSTSPILCAKIPFDWTEPITCTPVSLGLPYPIAHATGLSKSEDRIFVSLVSGKKNYIAVLQQSDLTPVFYQELFGVIDCHSILAIKDKLYVVSTGTDEVLRYDISNNSLNDLEVFWQASGAQKDTHHINSIVEKNEEILISAFGIKTGQLMSTATNGYIYNITKDVRVREGIYHPHSLSVRNGRIYYSDSQKNTFCSVEDDAPLFNLNGYTRGVAWLSDDLVCMTSSIGRRISKSTGLIANPADPGVSAGECSLKVGNIVNRKIITQIDLSWFGPEVYDLLTLEGDIDLLSTTIMAHLSERKLVQTLIKEKEHVVQLLSTQIEEKDKALQALAVGAAEKEKQLSQILVRNASRFAEFLRGIRTQLLPLGSLRERVVKFIAKKINGFRVL